MIWDARNLIRRGGGRWPRDWREICRDPIRPPLAGDRKSRAGKRAPEACPGTEPGLWLKAPWAPPPGSADAWRDRAG